MEKKTKRVTDVQYVLKENASRRIRKELNDLIKTNKDKHTTEYIGCSINELKTYIQNQFTTNMSWNNYGKVWEIDHVIPCKAWDLQDTFESLCCWNYRNLQPLYCDDNRRKKDSYSLDDKKKYIEICRGLFT